jgi:hypothetical protein
MNSLIIFFSQQRLSLNNYLGMLSLLNLSKKQVGSGYRIQINKLLEMHQQGKDPDKVDEI